MKNWRDDQDEWRFDEHPSDLLEEEGRGRWSTASARRLKIREQGEQENIMPTKEKKVYVKVVTPEFRVSFPQVFEPKGVNPGDKLKFSVQMLFQVKETEKSRSEGRAVVDIRPLKEAALKIIHEKFGTDRSKWPDLKLPFRDGAETGKKDQEGYGDGIIFVNASSSNKPGIVDGQKQPIIMPSEFYGGCYARATVNPYYWKYMGKEGVSFGLQNLQKLRDGDAFSGRSKPEEDFDAIEPPTGGATAADGDPCGL